MIRDDVALGKLGGFSAQIAELRKAFDQSFALPANVVEESSELILLVRVGAHRHGVRLSEIAGIHRCPKIVPLPGVKSSCLGIVGLRGRLHAVFHLAALLRATEWQKNPEWLLLAPGREAPTFGVDAIESCLAIKTEALRTLDRAADSRAHVYALFVHEGSAHELLDFPSLVAQATGHSSPPHHQG